MNNWDRVTKTTGPKVKIYLAKFVSEQHPVKFQSWLQSNDQKSEDTAKVYGTKDTPFPLVQQRVKGKLVETEGVLQPMFNEVTSVQKHNQVLWATRTAHDVRSSGYARQELADQGDFARRKSVSPAHSCQLDFT